MINRIIIDAGHNGLTDPGAVFNGRRESDDTLRLANAVGEILTRNGYDVVYTRTGDLSQSVVQKAELANAANGDLFVSIHRNMGTYPEQYNGVQTLIYDRQGIKVPMAENINRNLEGLGFRNINVDVRPDLAVLRRTRMPALLVEAGFLDSQKDNQLFDTRLDEIAQAIADGIMDTLNTEEASALSMTSSPSAPWSSFQTEAQGAEADAISRQPLYRVQVGAFHNLQNAVQLEQELKRLGYNTWIVTV
ncbi:MAG: N-acetylmuramoyl-L-alanine amidase [Lachnospiraceae bacterium]|nr:N-acetylmuramoyl-L-alanine amidase [Lachnospiraceae bacterium]